MRNLFSSREGLVDQAVKDSIATFVNPDLDGEIVDSWILTEYVDKSLQIMLLLKVFLLHHLMFTE